MTESTPKPPSPNHRDFCLPGENVWVYGPDVFDAWVTDPTSYAVYEAPGAEITSLEAFWTVIAEAINGPDGYFGSHLDAFRDCLRGGYGTPVAGFTIRWLDSEVSRAALGYPETVRQLKLRLEHCHPLSREHVAQQLHEAEQGRGPTVFDWLVEMIEDEPTASLELL